MKQTSQLVLVENHSIEENVNAQGLLSTENSIFGNEPPLNFSQISQQRQLKMQSSKLESNRVHILYTGTLRDDVVKEKTLTHQQLEQVKQTREELHRQSEELKQANQLVLASIKRYVKLIKQA